MAEPRIRRLFAVLLLLGASLAAAGEPPTAEEAFSPKLNGNGNGQDWAVLDPWERFNRPMHRFNRAIDDAFFRPVAKGYAKVTPKLVRTGIGQFFSNLQQPIVALNLLLQGRPGQAGTATGRFLLNATFGLGGFLDPATHAGIPKRDKDFGQTFAQWGWKQSRYLVLPAFGPATLRDGLGKGLNTRISPISELARRHGPGVTFVYGIDTRASVLHLEGLMGEVEDDYIFFRDIYYQRRACQIRDCSEDLPDYLLPDYEFEIPDLDWRR